MREGSAEGNGPALVGVCAPLARALNCLPAFAAAPLPTAGAGEEAGEGRPRGGARSRLRLPPTASLLISLRLTSAAGPSGLSIKRSDTETEQLEGEGNVQKQPLTCRKKQKNPAAEGKKKRQHSFLGGETSLKHNESTSQS